VQRPNASAEPGPPVTRISVAKSFGLKALSKIIRYLFNTLAVTVP